MMTTSGVIRSEKWGKDKLTVVIEREGVRYTVAHFNAHEEALAEQLYQEALHTHVDDFPALRERYNAMRAGAPNALSGTSKPEKPKAETGVTAQNIKRLIDEAEKVGRELKRLQSRAADVNALLRKAEIAHDKAWAKVQSAIEDMKQG